MFGEMQRFFGAAAKNKGVTSLESNDLLSFERLGYQELVERLLADCV